jgi:hypothetical protein
MDIINNRWNKSTIFILPLLYPDIKYTDILQDNFINCYISDVDNIEPENSLLIEFDDNIARFKVPDNFIQDYKKILRGNYSSISESSKKVIINFWNQNEESYLFSVLYKTSKILEYWTKKANKQISHSHDKEYWPKFNIYSETRGLHHLYKIVNFNLIK